MPTMARAMSMNMGMMVTYDEVKERVCRYMGRAPDESTKIVRAMYTLKTPSFYISSLVQDWAQDSWQRLVVFRLIMPRPKCKK